MLNKILLGLILISFIGFCTGLTSYLYESEVLSKMEGLSAVFFIITSCLFLLKNGTLRHRKYAWIAYLGVFVLFTGVIFKVMRWPYNSVIIITGIFFILTVYLYHFIKKTDKKQIDWLKFVFVFMYFSTRDMGDIVMLDDDFINFMFYTLIVFISYILFLFFYKSETPKPSDILDV